VARKGHATRWLKRFLREAKPVLAAAGGKPQATSSKQQAASLE